MNTSILLVEDEEDILKVLGISLKDMGYEVHTAESGKKALDVFRAVEPPVVITDIRMPGIDGMELLRKIKQERPETEVIMITDRGDIDLAIESLKNEATDFVMKPIRDDALEIALKRASEKILTREKLKEYSENRAMYHVVINKLIQEDVMVISFDYRILDINDTLLEKLGLQREEVIGRHCYEISHHQDAPCEGESHPCPLHEIRASNKPSQTTHVHRDKDDKERFYSISCYPIFEEAELIGVIELSRDITRDIHVQKLMMQQEKLASIGRLSAGVAHEINNPLTTILTTAMLILEDADPEDPTHRDLQLITDETLRCRKIVSSLLDFARQSKPVKRPNDINALVSECVVLTRKQAAFNDVALEKRLMNRLPLASVDKDQVLQSLINITLNAIEASDPGGEVTLETRFDAEAESIQISIIDTGEGISSENMDKVFDPFFTTKEVGTGLGLAVTHGIIQQHGGTLDLESEPGVGTTVTIRLPLDSGGADDP